MEIRAQRFESIFKGVMKILDDVNLRRVSSELQKVVTDANDQVDYQNIMYITHIMFTYLLC